MYYLKKCIYLIKYFISQFISMVEIQISLKIRISYYACVVRIIL